mmetsp:Transcript_27917/g.26770  ORF Transcript_27917/g.26770 Transcript_27917/m.26770 type:complete len:1397 (+) Transcript_27917:334-4524(+)
MSIQERMYNDTIGAMNASLSSITTKEQRQQVDAFLMQLKEEKMCLEIMIHILTVESPNHNDFIRMLSLTILNDWLKIWWNKINENEQTAIRNNVFLLLKGSVGRSPIKGLWTKLAVMISNIAVRQFPQMWPSYLEDMVSVCLAAANESSISGEQEIAIMAIEFTASDSIDTDYCSSLPIERRQDILAGFRNKLTQLLDFFYNFLLQCTSQYSALPPPGSAGPDIEQTRARLIRLMGGILRMLTPIAMFAKPEDLCDGAAGRDFSMIAVQFLCNRELQAEAVDLLHIVTDHKLPLDVFTRLVEAIPSLSSPLLLPIPPAQNGGTSLPEDIAECLIFQRTYAETVFSLFSQNISQAAGSYYLKSTPRAQEILGSYVMLMANLIAQPSRRLAADVLKDWGKIFREEAIVNLPWMKDVCAVVLRVYTDKMKRILWEQPLYGSHSSSDHNIGIISSAVPIDDTAAAEFDDYDDWVDYSGALKSQVKSLCVICATKFPLVCLSFLHERIGILLALPVRAPVGDREDNDADVVIEWQAYGIIVEAILSKLPSIWALDSSVATNEDREIGTQMLSLVEKILTWSPPNHTPLIIQRLQCLQNCSIVLKLGPLDLLQRGFADLFKHDSISLGSLPGADSGMMQISEKASTVIAHLCHNCGEKAVVDSTLLGAIVAQVSGMIAARTTQQPTTQLQLQSLQNQRGCLRESLVALSDRLGHQPTQQKELLVMSLADVVGKWQEIVPVSTEGGLFSTVHSLLDGCYTNNNSVAVSKDLLGVILSSSKRVTCAPLPEGIWEVDTPQSTPLAAMVDKALPFYAVWQAVIPGIKTALKTLHGIWEPSTRESLSTGGTSGLYLPPVSLVRRAAGLPNIHPNSEDQSLSLMVGESEGMRAVSKHLSEIRVLMYQVLGQACSHKALYACPDHAAIVSDLSLVLPWLENHHLSQLMKTFVECYVLNSPPVQSDIVAKFLEAFLGTTFRRVAVCWHKHGEGGDVSPSCTNIWRACSIPSGFAKMEDDIIENARKSICVELVKTYGDLLASFACCRGFLALDMPTSAAYQSAAMLGISTKVSVNIKSQPKANAGGGGKKGKKKAQILKEVVEAEEETSADSSEWLKLHKAVRRKALHHLMMINPRYQQAVTAPFVASAVSLVGLPDSTACRKGIALAEHFALQCRGDRRLVSAVGKEAFSAALCVLLQGEAWSEGLEYEIIDFLVSVYGLLVFGETLAPDGAILPAVPVNSNTNGSQKGPKSGSTFGAMSQWSGPGKGQGQSSSSGGRNSGRGSGRGSNSNSQQDSNDIMLTDLPRQILMQIQSFTPQMLETLEKEMLGTTSKKKRREYFKDMLKVAGVGGTGDLAGAIGKRDDASVLDIRRKLLLQKSSTKSTNNTSFFDVQQGLAGSDLNLSSFFGE